MPESSIIKDGDKYSDTVKKMAQVTRAFQKDMEELDRPRAYLVRIVGQGRSLPVASTATRSLSLRLGLVSGPKGHGLALGLAPVQAPSLTCSPPFFQNLHPVHTLSCFWVANSQFSDYNTFYHIKQRSGCLERRNH